MTEEKTAERLTIPDEKGSVHGKPTRLTAEQVAAMSESEREQLIQELNASLEELHRPPVQPYPKWVEIDGVSQVVETEEEEQRKTKAAADAKAKEGEKKQDEGENRRR